MPDYKTDAGLSSHLQKQAATIDQFKSEASASEADFSNEGELIYEQISYFRQIF